MPSSFEDLPTEMTNRFVEEPGGHGEVHGMGETAVPPVAAALGNAIRDAVGVRIHDLPLTPQRVLRAMLDHEAGQNGAAPGANGDASPPPPTSRAESEQ